MTLEELEAKVKDLEDKTAAAEKTAAERKAELDALTKEHKKLNDDYASLKKEYTEKFKGAPNGGTSEVDKLIDEAVKYFKR